MIQLQWHDYGYFPYERDLAEREVRALLGVENCVVSENGILLSQPVDAVAADRWTYFAKVIGALGSAPTTQALLENAVRAAARGRLLAIRCMASTIIKESLTRRLPSPS